MTDASAVFFDMQARFYRQTFIAMQRLLNDDAMQVDLCSAMVVAPVMEASGLFELDPAPRPPKKAWRWIIPVRFGAWDDDCRWGNSKTNPMQREALNGLYFDDLVACDPKALVVKSRLLGIAPVCGWPLDADMSPEPVFVHETPLAWLLSLGSGVFLCGDPLEQQTWLRGCHAGITAGSLAMGEAIMRKMRRQIPALPEVKVFA
jgi:hypothetical protein